MFIFVWILWQDYIWNIWYVVFLDTATHIWYTTNCTFRCMSAIHMLISMLHTSNQSAHRAAAWPKRIPLETVSIFVWSNLQIIKIIQWALFSHAQTLQDFNCRRQTWVKYKMLSLGMWRNQNILRKNCIWHQHLFIWGTLKFQFYPKLQLPLSPKHQIISTS